LNTFGKRIRALREARGMSQRDAAKGMGVSSGFLAQLEGGTNDNPTIATVRKISEFYGVTVDVLIPSDASLPDIKNRMVREAVGDLSPEESEKTLDYMKFLKFTAKAGDREPEAGKAVGADGSDAEPLTN